MTKTRRQERVASLFQAAISEIIQRDLHLVDKAFIVVSRVEMSGDLKTARVYLRVFGEAAGHDVLGFFERRRAHIRKILASKINMKYNPELFFALDPVAEHEQKIDTLLDKIKRHE